MRADQLLRQAQQGDRKAQERLFLDASERLLLYIRMRLGKGLRERLDSIDVLQETWLAVCRDFGSFEPQGPAGLERWLCRVAENRIRDLADYHRAHKRAAQGMRVPLSAIIQTVRDRNTGPQTAAERAERLGRLELAMDSLPEDQRSVLLLRHFQGLAVDAIAAQRGSSPSAVRRLLGRAHLRLGDLLLDESEDRDG